MSTAGGGKKRQKSGKGAAKKARDVKAVAMAISGHTNQEIEAELGLGRHAVSKILNSDEAKRILSAAESDLKRLIIDSVLTLQDALGQRNEFQMMGHAVKVALAVLKNSGLMRESIDLNHQFPKPLVIRRRNGEEIVLGTELDVKDDEETE